MPASPGERASARGRAAALAFVLLGIPACATPEAGRLLAERDRDDVLALEVPFHAQRRDHCGPAALAMVLNQAGDPVTPLELDSTAFTAGRGGSLQLDVLTAARRRGALAYPVDDLEKLFAELDAGAPVLVVQDLG